MRLVIVDYGVGNLGSILNMFKKIGAAAELSSDAETIAAADKLVLPGVGAFDACVSALHERGLVEPLERRVLHDGIPVLGLCVGYQMMTRGSEEGTKAGLGWIDAWTTRLDTRGDTRLKIPHMGWDIVERVKSHPLTDVLPEEPRFYFVHSYAVQCADRSDALLSLSYGGRFDAAAQKDNVMGVQFHPEKSHKYGMALFRNFVERC